MPPMASFKRLDVRPMLLRGEEPLPEILARAQALSPGDGLIIIAPFIPSPLIDLLAGEGFQVKLERGDAGSWIVYLWREQG